jgi:hypothetical protein
LLALHDPAQPSDRRKLPEPLRPESRPELITETPLKLPTVRTPPPELTVPLTPSAIILPLVTSTAPVVVPPQPTEVTIHAPSKLPPPPPPPLLRAARRGSSGSGLGLLRRTGLAVSTARGVARDPDNDFSSLPMLPPVLPCANAAPAPIAKTQVMLSRAVLIVRWTVCCIIDCFQFLARVRMNKCHCFDEVSEPVQPSDVLNVPVPLRPDARPVLVTVTPL